MRTRDVILMPATEKMGWKICPPPGRSRVARLQLSDVRGDLISFGVRIDYCYQPQLPQSYIAKHSSNCGANSIYIGSSQLTVMQDGFQRLVIYSASLLQASFV